MINFANVEKSVKALKKQLHRDEFDERTFEEKLLELVDVAEDGYYWMLGHESGRWYRHDGKRWVADDPGEMFVPLVQILAQESIKARWKAVDLVWFAVGLIIIAVVAVVIFTSAL